LFPVDLFNFLNEEKSIEKENIYLALPQISAKMEAVIIHHVANKTLGSALWAESGLLIA